MLTTGILLFFIGFVVWLFGTLSGGGGAILFLSFAGLILPVKEVAPITSLVGGTVCLSRIALFFKKINWGVLTWLLLGSVIGVGSGVYLLVNIHPVGLTLIFSLFLIVSGLFHFIPGAKLSFKMRPVYYLPIGALTAFTSAFVGAVGPVINVFFLHSDITKERLLATSSVNSFLVQLLKVGSYVFVAHLDFAMAISGLMAASGAIAGTLVGKWLLPKVSNRLFMALANFFLLGSGIFLLLRYMNHTV